MSWSSRKKKEGIFCTVHFAWRKFFNICVLCQCIVYWIHFQNIRTFKYQKTLLHALSLVVFKIVESPQCILKWKILLFGSCFLSCVQAENHHLNDLDWLYYNLKEFQNLAPGSPISPPYLVIFLIITSSHCPSIVFTLLFFFFLLKNVFVLPKDSN